VDRATLTGQIQTVFGWPLKVGPSPDPTRPAANPRALSNFPVQGNAAEMLRLACCLLVERGIGLCAPVHDAVMVEGPADRIEDVVAQTRAAMAEASRVVLRGCEIGADAKIVSWPERYVDDAGAAFWETVMRLAGPGPEIFNPDDVVRHDGRSSSSQRPNRSGLLRESSKGVSFSSSTDGGGA
jgi:hypothetical protein